MKGLLLVAGLCGGLFFFLPFARETGFPVTLVQQTGNRTHVSLVFKAPERSGPLAHYTEHLAWLPNIGKGSRPEDRDSNAWTNDYALGYWLSGPSDDLPGMLGRLKTVFDPIDLPREMADTERDIILREYDLRIANNTDAQAAEAAEAFLYAGNAVAASVIGTPEQIKALSYDDAQRFHTETHRPDRARLVVIGDVSERQLSTAMAKAGFPDLQTRREDAAPSPFILAAPATQTFRLPDPHAAPRMLWRKVVALPEPVDLDLLEAQSALARDILDTNLPGGLAGPLRFEAFITQSFSISITPIDERHIELFFAAEPDKGVSFAQMQTAFESALATAGQGVPAPTYARVRERFKGFWPNWSDDEMTAQWMTDYTLARVTELRDPKTQHDIRKLDAKINAAAIDALIAALSGPGRTAITFIGTEPLP